MSSFFLTDVAKTVLAMPQYSKPQEEIEFLRRFFEQISGGNKAIRTGEVALDRSIAVYLTASENLRIAEQSRIALNCAIFINTRYHAKFDIDSMNLSTVAAGGFFHSLKNGNIVALNFRMFN